jgi:serine/threonine protein phosphatase PrpC
MVCDGMGGHAGGEVAAGMAIDSVAARFRRHAGSLPSLDSMRFASLANAAIKHASSQIHHVAAEQAELQEMGTTLSLLLITRERAFIANVGDSRVYLIRGGQSRLLTTDQTMGNELLARGYSPHDPLLRGRFSRLLTHSVGEGESVVVDTLSMSIKPGDRFLLCTDGLSRYFDDEREVAHYAEHERLQAAAHKLVQLSKRRGGSDNITALVVAVEPEFTDGSTMNCRLETKGQSSSAG